MIFYFFVNVRDHQDVYVGWRVGHFLFMAATVVIGVLFERLHTLPRGVCAPFAWIGVVVVLPGGAADHGHRHLQHAGHHQFQPGAGGPLDAAADAG